MFSNVETIAHNIYNHTVHLGGTYLLHWHPLSCKETSIISTQMYVHAADILMQLEGVTLNCLQQINVLQHQLWLQYIQSYYPGIYPRSLFEFWINAGSAQQCLMLMLQALCQ